MLDIVSLCSLTAVFGSFMCHIYTFWLFANCIDITDEIVGYVLIAELYLGIHFVRSCKLNRSLFCSYFILLLSAILAATELLLNYSFSVSVAVRHMNIQI